MNALNTLRAWILFHKTREGHGAAGRRLCRLEEVKALMACERIRSSTE